MDSQKLAGKRKHDSKDSGQQFKKKKLNNGSSKPSGGTYKEKSDFSHQDSQGKGKVFKSKGGEKSPLKPLRVLHNQLTIKKKDMRLSAADKQGLVQKCIGLMENKYKELCFKHDGCRILQACIKHGSQQQRDLLIKELKPLYKDLMSKKYSHYLATKMYDHSNADDKLEILNIVCENMPKLISHMDASEVIEYIYVHSNGTQKKKMKYSLYGKYFLLLDVQNESNTTDLSKFFEEKPTLKEGILKKLEKTSQKFVEKGLTRHSIVQALLADFISNAELDKVQNFADLSKETLPSFLASKEGLYVACKLFTVADKKGRKAVMKTLTGLVKDMCMNEVGHWFIIKILNTIDDTKLAQKVVIKEILDSFEDITKDENGKRVILGLFDPENKQIFPEPFRSYVLDNKDTSSKKDSALRRNEVVGMVFEKLGKILEDKMQHFAVEEKPFLISAVLKYIVEDNYEHGDDILEEFYRVIQKKINVDNEQQTLIAHPVTHRIIKGIMKHEYEFHKAKGDEFDLTHLKFSQTISEILKKGLKELLQTRAVYIAIQIVETLETKPLLSEEMKKMKKELKDIGDKNKNLKGINILVKKL